MAFKLRVRDGQHSQGHPDNPAATVTYYAGQEFENDADLATRWPEKFERADRQVSGPPAETHIRPGESIAAFATRMAALAAAQQVPTSPQPASVPAKDEKLAPTTPPKTREETVAALNKATVKELQELVEEKEIDLHGQTKKDDIIKAILADYDN